MWLLKSENNSAAYINLSIKGINSYFFLDVCAHLTPLENGHNGFNLAWFPQPPRQHIHGNN